MELFYLFIFQCSLSENTKSLDMNEYLVDHMVAINAKCNCVSIVFSEQQPFWHCLFCNH